MNLAESKINIGFIGAGVMGTALIKSLLDSSIKPDHIFVCEKDEARVSEVANSLKVNALSLIDIVKKCHVLFLAVKPQDLENLLNEIGDKLNADTLIISIAAGKKTKLIENLIKTANPVIRVMPNTPAQIGKGVCVISAGSNATKKDLELTKQLLDKSGLVVEVNESDQDAVTALSGSGPAYFFAFVESVINSGVNLGLSKEVATQLAVGTILGSAAMLNESGQDAATLRKNVTSPNGTTAAALKVFTDKNLEAIIHEAMLAAKNRSQELA
jgi:pyrroline-5-carboxylate reductase